MYSNKVDVLKAAAARDENQQTAIYDTQDCNTKQSSQQHQVWRDGVIVSSQPACSSEKSTLIQVNVQNETLEEYTTPGQFVQFRPAGDDSIDPIFLAMSSAPGKNTFEFLIKNSPRLPWLSDTLVAGTTIQISKVLGDGFPLQRIRQNKTVDTILLAAAGSGIAPLKACIESGMLFSTSQPNSNTKIVLYYGEWTNDDICFAKLFDSWKSDCGVTIVHSVLSRTPDTQGYIQDVLSHEKIVSDTKGTTWTVICGMDDMVESCTQVLTDKFGVEKNHILLNY